MRRPAGGRSAPVLAAALGAMLATGALACAGGGSVAPPALPGEGMDFATSDRILRAVAARCQSGADGRTALLALASAHLDPRNPAAHPDSAALMAARLLYVPDLPPAERRLGESLYALALQRGGDPGLRPAPDDRGMAHRFDRCGTPMPRRVVSLPVVTTVVPASPVEMQEEERRLRAELDALERARLDLVGRVTELEAEVERLRRLLGRDTVRAAGSALPG